MDSGRAKKVTIDKDNSTIIEGAASPRDIEGRVKQIRSQVENTTSDYEKEKLQERLAKFPSAALPSLEGRRSDRDRTGSEKKARVEDAMHATRAAVKEGIAAGGGSGSAPPTSPQSRSLLSHEMTKPLAQAS